MEALQKSFKDLKDQMNTLRSQFQVLENEELDEGIENFNESQMDESTFEDQQIG